MAQVDLSKLDFGERTTRRFVYYDNPSSTREEMLTDNYFYPAYETGVFSKQEIICVRWEKGLNIEKVIWLRVYWEDAVIKAEEVTAESATGAGSGDVVGPPSSVEGEIAVYADTTGKLISGDSVNLLWDDQNSELKTENIAAQGNITTARLLATVDNQGAIVKCGILDIPEPDMDIPLLIGQANPAAPHERGMSMARVAEVSKASMTNPQSVNAEMFIHEPWTPQTAYDATNLFGTSVGWASQIPDIARVGMETVYYPPGPYDEYVVLPGLRVGPDRCWDYADNYNRGDNPYNVKAVAIDLAEDKGYISIKAGHVYEIVFSSVDLSGLHQTKVAFYLAIATGPDADNLTVDSKSEIHMTCDNPSDRGSVTVTTRTILAPTTDTNVYVVFKEIPGSTLTPELIQLSLTAKCLF